MKPLCRDRSIISARSGLALSVAYGRSATVDVSLIQEAYRSYYRQQWKIIQTDEGYYKIKPQSSENAENDLVMAVGYGLTNDPNGVNIEQRKYVADSTYKDEWEIFLVGSEALLLGVRAEGSHDHHSVQGTIMSDIQDLGYKSINSIVTDHITRSSVQDLMEQCKIFVSRSHAGSDENGTFIGSSKDDQTTIGTSEIFDYSTNTPVIGLSGCDLMLFVACYTAAVDGSSLPDAAVSAGAQCGVGFEKRILCDEANEWVKYFFHYYLQGYSIQKSAQIAAENCSSTSGLDSYRVVNR